MLRIGLTGNMGSGKSLVAGIFEALGIPLYHSDEESKRFLSDPGIRSVVKKEFGDATILPSGDIDRRVLATVVFADPGKLTFLNSILHPHVMEDFRGWCGRYTQHPYVVLESAILFETGLDRGFDRVIHVSCPEETAIDRVTLRDGITREEVRRRLRFQLPDTEKATLADFVIRNDGSELVIPQVLEIHRELSEGRP